MGCTPRKRPCLSPGELRHRVTLQAKTQTTDIIGGATVAWSKVTDLWAKIEPQSGMQTFRMGQLETPITHKVTIRYRAGVTANQRLLFGSRVFEIVEALNPEEANVMLVLRCREGELDA